MSLRTVQGPCLKGALIALLLVASPVTPLHARSGHAVSSFRNTLKLSTTPQAYARAEGRLARVHLGMTQKEFFSVMEMLLLMRGGRAVAAALEGYLGSGPDASGACEDGAPVRRLVFGFRDGGRDVRKVVIVFRGEHLSEVRHLTHGHDARDTWLGEDIGRSLTCDEPLLLVPSTAPEARRSACSGRWLRTSPPASH